jgi:hypothetical protein
LPSSNLGFAFAKLTASNSGLRPQWRRSSLAVDIEFQYHGVVNTKQRKLLIGIYARPTSASIVFADIESLIKALGGTVREREGSRVSISLMGEEWRCHRPHPGKEAKRYQVEQARDLLERIGVHP